MTIDLDAIRSRHQPIEELVDCGHTTHPDNCTGQVVERICAFCTEPWPCDTDRVLEADRDKLREHSKTLNTISWKIAEALGHSIDSSGHIIANPDNLAQQLIDRYRSQPQRHDPEAIARAVLNAAAQKLLDRAGTYPTDGPRSTWRRAMRAAARLITPEPTEDEMRQALAGLLSGMGRYEGTPHLDHTTTPQEQ